MELIQKKIRDVPDFPKKGIIFKDITPILNDPKTFKTAVDIFAERYKDKKIDMIVAVEARGFIWGAALAYKLETGFSIVRKPGKLPYKTIKESYELEYGTDTLEMHVDGIKKGQRVLIIDDLLATGGTAKATAKLVEDLQGQVVEIAFLIELGFLKGREKLKNYKLFSAIKY